MDDQPNPYASPQSDFAAAGQAWMRDQSGQLRSVYIGLSLCYWGIVLMLLGLLVGAAGGLAAGMIAGPGASMILGFAGIGMAIVGAILSFVGPFFCLTVPAESGAKGFIIASVILQLGNFFITPALTLVDLPGFSGFTGTLASPLISFAGIMAFILFMQRLSSFIGRGELVARTNRVLVGAGLVFVSWMGIIGYAVVGRAEGFGLFVPLLGLAALVVFVMYANLLNDLRKHVKQQGERGTSAP